MKKLTHLLGKTASEWFRRDAPKMGAALAFYSILSLAPLVIVVVGICGLILGYSNAGTQLVEQFRQMVGNDGAAAVETVLNSVRKPANGIIAGLFGIVTLLFGASGVLVELRSDLNQLWHARPPSEPVGIGTLIRDRFLSFAMILGVGFLLLVSLIISASLAVASRFFSSFGVLPPSVWQGINILVSLGFVAALFALIFRFVPDKVLPWPAIWRGAVLTAVLFTLGKAAIGLYLGHAGVGSAYGTAGSLVVLVVWIYYSSQIFLFGAIFTRLYAEERSSLEPSAEGTPPPSASHIPKSNQVHSYCDVLWPLGCLRSTVGNNCIYSRYIQ